MRRGGKIGIAASAVLATAVVTGGMLAVGQELNVDDNPGEPLTLEGVETGVAAQDPSGAVSGARIRAEGTTPKVEPVVEQPVVDEVPPADPVVIAPRRAAPAPASARLRRRARPLRSTTDTSGATASGATASGATDPSKTDPSSDGAEAR